MSLTKQAVAVDLKANVGGEQCSKIKQTAVLYVSGNKRCIIISGYLGIAVESTRCTFTAISLMMSSFQFTAHPCCCWQNSHFHHLKPN